MKPSPLLDLPAPTMAAPAVHGATPMSEVRRRTRAMPHRFDAASTLARASLALPFIAMSTSGCLITDPPQFTAPPITAPILLESTAVPPTQRVVIVDEGDMTMQSYAFTAQFISQDDTSGTSQFSEVEAALYIDYGFTGHPGEPYGWYIPGNSIKAGTIETTGRTAAGEWEPLGYPEGYGCHTATLAVSHIFEQSGCPACPNDFSTITWQMLVCNSTMPGMDCTEFPTSGPTSCAGLTSSCSQVGAGAGTGTASCPESVDGGAGGGGS